MRVLIISTSPPEYSGGLANFTKNLLINLGNNGIKTDFLCSSLTKERTIYEEYTNKIRIIKKRCYLFADNNNVFRLKNPVFNVLSFLIKYGRNYDLIHVHSYIYFATIQTFIFKLLFRRGIPVILHLHGGIQTSVYQVSSFLEKVLLFFKKYFFDLIVGKILIKQADAIISVSKDDLLILNKVFHVKRKNYNYYIPNAVETDKFKRNPHIKRKYLAFIGRLTKIKGFDLFLKLIEEFNKINKNQHFLIIGTGPYLRRLKSFINTYPIDFYENLPHRIMPEFYNKCLIFIQTSRAEGLPTCILEALSCEVPVVASNVGGTKELVKNGKTGYIYKTGNIDEAIKHILSIINNKTYEIMGKEAKKLIEDKFSWKKIITKIIMVYKITLRRRDT